MSSTRVSSTKVSPASLSAVPERYSQPEQSESKHRFALPGSSRIKRPAALALAATIVVIGSACSGGSGAGSAPNADVMVGYSTAFADQQRSAEAEAIAIPDAARARAHSRELSKEPHIAGTPAQARTRDYVIEQMKAMGLETDVRTYNVWLPHATTVRVTKLYPEVTALSLDEPPIPGDPVTAMKQYPTVNGSSGEGTAEGEVVFVNFGLIEDYAVLESLGVSVEGKIVLARYGRSFRGIKAREAEKRGALAILIYTDPADDGYARGDVYPEGPMRPMGGVQRGSVNNANGDPLTPGYASVPGAPRLGVDEAGLPRIPSVPISAANAMQILKDIRGTDLPAGWQGGLPLRYHVGAGPVRVRVTVETDAATNGTKEIWNTFGFIRGTEFPDEYVIMGSHRDAWGAGAADNVSGTVSVLEAAKALSELASKGIRPRRTIVLATWDAEEWGLVGSTEYVEDDSLNLKRGAVAYLNQDVAAQGSRFNGAGSPSMRPVLRDVLKRVPHPVDSSSVYAMWRVTSDMKSDTLEPAMGDPGGGSDFAGFYNHFGIPIVDWGFGGPAGTYHSAYDTFEWMERFGDPGFVFHATAGRIGAATLLRLANAEVLPYDYTEFAVTMKNYVFRVREGFEKNGWDAKSVGELDRGIATMEKAARAFASERDRVLAAAESVGRYAATNTALLQVERAFARPEGLKRRPWYRTLIYAADIDNGYANISFPGISEEIRYGDAKSAEAEVKDLAARFVNAAGLLDEARKALREP